MNVYESVRAGIAEDFRKARAYDSMKADLERQLNIALSNPNKDAWTHGYHTGWEAAMRRIQNDRPLAEKDEYEKFKASRANSNVPTGD